MFAGGGDIFIVPPLMVYMVIYSAINSNYASLFAQILWTLKAVCECVVVSTIQSGFPPFRRQLISHTVLAVLLVRLKHGYRVSLRYSK